MNKIEQNVLNTLMDEKTNGEKKNEEFKVSLVRSLMSGLGVEMKKDIDKFNSTPQKKKSFIDRLFKTCSN